MIGHACTLLTFSPTGRYLLSFSRPARAVTVWEGQALGRSSWLQKLLPVIYATCQAFRVQVCIGFPRLFLLEGATSNHHNFPWLGMLSSRGPNCWLLQSELVRVFQKAQYCLQCRMNCYMKILVSIIVQLVMSISSQWPSWSLLVIITGSIRRRRCNSTLRSSWRCSYSQQVIPKLHVGGGAADTRTCSYTQRSNLYFRTYSQLFTTVRGGDPETYGVVNSNKQ